MRVLVLNGVNLNVLGRRDPKLYGGLSIAELESQIYEWARELELTVQCRQTNRRGRVHQVVPRRVRRRRRDRRQPGRVDALRLGDPRRARAARRSRIVEVHLSNVDEREEWRKTSVLSDLVAARFVGHGPDGYRMALDYLKEKTP